MINNTRATAVTGYDRAAASARPVLAVLSLVGLGGELCPQHGERFAGFPVTPTTPAVAVRRRLGGWGDAQAMKTNKFDVQPVPGSSVWRPPV